MNYYQNKQSNTGYQNKNAVSLQELLRMPDNKFITEENYVDKAMSCFNDMKAAITSSKLRSLYSMLCDIVTNESDNHSDKIGCLPALKRLRVHMIYDMGRDTKVKEFVEKTYLVAYLKRVEETQSRNDFNLYCKYFEALVAFHRYLNPTEK